MKVVIIDYGSGNLKSVFNAFESINLGIEIIISNKVQDLKSASHIVLPGVGAFADCMKGLKSTPCLIEELRNQVLREKKPFLGICVGMQVLASSGNENGESQGLGFIDGRVQKIISENNDLKIPHMGWNELILSKINHPLLKDIKSGDHVYFANSYHFLCQNEGNIIAQVEYGGKINAMIAKNNIVGIQFHPEKSGEVGLKILKNFLEWRYL